MIRELTLQDFKGHRSTTVPLGPFTLLVGDNGSGKSSVLEALWLQSAIALDPAILGDDYAPTDLIRRGAQAPIVIASASDQLSSHIEIILGGSGDWSTSVGVKKALATLTAEADRRHGMHTGSWKRIREVMWRARLYSFNAARIAQAAYSDDPTAVVLADGTNTAVALAALKLGDDEQFDIVEESLRTLVPAVERIRIRPAKVGNVVGSKLFFDFRGAGDVPAHHASHGTLIALSLLTVLHSPNRPDIVLLDDLDHALHPRAQIELVRLLRQLVADVAGVQIVATTHSPYILDEVDADDVVAFAVRDDGTVASRRLSDHPEAEKMGDSLTAGQLWSLDRERDWVLQ